MKALRSPYWSASGHRIKIQGIYFWTNAYQCSIACLPAGGDEEDTKDRTKQKACLERYRKACIEILGVLHKAAPQVWQQVCKVFSHELE